MLFRSGVCLEAVGEKLPAVYFSIGISVCALNELLHAPDSLLVADRSTQQLALEPGSQLSSLQHVILVFVPPFEDVLDVLVAEVFCCHCQQDSINYMGLILNYSTNPELIQTEE